MSDLTVDKETTIGNFGQVSRRVVSYEEGAALAESLNLSFCECTSAVADDDSVEMCLMQTTVKCLKQAELRSPLPPAVAPNNPAADHNGSWCVVM
jgi:hypothetical protein